MGKGWNEGGISGRKFPGPSVSWKFDMLELPRNAIGMARQAECGGLSLDRLLCLRGHGRLRAVECVCLCRYSGVQWCRCSGPYSGYRWLMSTGAAHLQGCNAAAVCTEHAVAEGAQAPVTST